MRFNTPDLDDPMAHPKSVRRAVAQQREAIWQAFREHNERIRPLLPPSLQRLLDANLHDAWVYTLRIDAERRTIDLHLRDCDGTDTAPGNFYGLHLTYTDIRLTPPQTALLCLIAREPGAEIYWDELEIVEGTEPPVYLHRMVWNAKVNVGPSINGYTTLCPEVELRFGGLEAVLEPNTPSGPDEKGATITLTGDPDVVTNTIFVL